MKKLFMIFLILFSMSLFSEPFWLNEGQELNIDLDNNRNANTLFLRWRDFGAHSLIELWVNNKSIKSIDAPKLQKIEYFEIDDENIESIKLVNKKENVLIYDYGIIYKDSTELENNMIKYNFSLRHYNDKNNIFELKDEIGKNYILLQFFQLHCIACQQKLPYLNKYSKIYNSTKIILVNAGEQADEIKEYFKKEEIDSDCIIDPEYEVCSQLEVYGVPHTIIFDKNGNIINRGNLSIEEIELILDNIE